jgi:hypothetical protein
MHGVVEKLWKFSTAAHDNESTGMLEITSMQIFHSAGLAAQQATTCHPHVRHPEVPI